jgi:hypothetical protein
MFGRAEAVDHIKTCIWIRKGLGIGNLELDRKPLLLGALFGPHRQTSPLPSAPHPHHSNTRIERQ